MSPEKPSKLDIKGWVSLCRQAWGTASLPAKPWRPEAVLGLGAMIFFCLAVGMLLVLGTGKYLPDLSKTEKGFLQFTIGAVFIHGAAFGLLFVFLRQHGTSWEEAFGFSRGNTGRAVWLGAGAFLVAVPGTLLLGEASEFLLKAFGITPQLQDPVKMLLNKPSLAQGLIYGFGAILLAPVAEEMIFRGVLYPALKNTGHRYLACLASSLLFASTHVNLLAFVPLTFLAMLMVWVYERTANLAAPITTHILFNALNFALLIIHPKWINPH